MNMTLEQKQELQGICESGVGVATIAYDPGTVEGDPEAAAIANGWQEYMRSDTANLVEVIYLSSSWEGAVFSLLTESGDTLTTESGDTLAIEGQ